MEASVLTQAWPHVEGTFRGKNFVWDTTDRHIAQPGTKGFEGGPVCSRFEGGKSFILPGCRGPGDNGYDPDDGRERRGPPPPLDRPGVLERDGGLVVERADGPRRLLDADAPVRRDRTDPRPPPSRTSSTPTIRSGTDGCSFREPQWCASVAAILGLTGRAGRASARAATAASAAATSSISRAASACCASTRRTSSASRWTSPRT